MTVERLQKILSNAGVASRRVAEEMVLEGRIAVNGTVQRTLGARADLDVDEVTLDGVPVVRDRYRYFLLNKPAGIVTTANDELGRDTVLDLVPIGDVQLHPVGRLDMDSEGLLILTNDGHLTGLLTHPRYGIEKEYLVGLDAPLTRGDVQRLVKGVESEHDRLRARSVVVVEGPEMEADDEEEVPQPGAWALVVLREGKNREVRRMMEAVGRKVFVLRRIRVGPVHLGAMGEGTFRELTDAEISALYRAGKAAEAQAGALPAAPAGRGERVGPPAGGRSSARTTGRPRAAAPQPPAPGRGGPPQGEWRGRTSPPGPGSSGTNRFAPARPTGPPPGAGGRAGGRPAEGPPGGWGRGKPETGGRAAGQGRSRPGGKPSGRPGAGGSRPPGDRPRGGGGRPPGRGR